MFSVLCDVNARGTTVVYVTHDPLLAERAHRVVSIRDGCLTGDDRR
jgi:predicted ABC-type transport system involved in lysophospholipase L1 biosynthesis ATPase subunit